MTHVRGLAGCWILIINVWVRIIRRVVTAVVRSSATRAFRLAVRTISIPRSPTHATIDIRVTDSCVVVTFVFFHHTLLPPKRGYLQKSHKFPSNPRTNSNTKSKANECHNHDERYSPELNKVFLIHLHSPKRGYLFASKNACANG